MAKTEMVLKLVKESSYTRPKFSYGYEDVHIYKFQDSDDNIYVWKTTNILCKEFSVGNILHWDFVSVGSTIRISASVKEESEYKGEKQIVLQRVKVIDIIERALTKEEIMEIKKKEQLDSIKDGDFIWKDMPYGQFKEHYSDCETIIGSFHTDRDHVSRIDVIIRDGRLKNSGTRGKHFHKFALENSKGEKIYAKAIDVDNAIRQAKKLHPEEEWKIAEIKIHDYIVEETYEATQDLHSNLKKGDTKVLYRGSDQESHSQMDECTCGWKSTEAATDYINRRVSLDKYNPFWKITYRIIRKEK